MEAQLQKNPISRELRFVTSGKLAMDGDGVKLTRLIGTPELDMLDPFLLLDAIGSDQPQDYIGGFPSHPHRGFETVTYLLDGRMRHKDSAGHEGVIEAGGVQWMTAGRGIIHSEMPEQENGLLRGFQLWLNLPASEKMREPAYQEFSADKIAEEHHDNGSLIRVIAGVTNKGTTGPVVNRHVEALFIDVSLPSNQQFQQKINSEHSSFVFLIKGELSVGDKHLTIGTHQLGVLSEGDEVVVKAKTDTRFLLLSARPLHEPVARSGPFVMNTKAEVRQAYEDLQSNRFLEN